MDKPQTQPQSRPLDIPQGTPFHWLYFVLFTLASVSALWQHGHPYFTLTMILLAMPLAAVRYVPLRWLPVNARNIIQVLLILGGVAWGTHRFMQSAPLDKVLIETITMMGLSFAFSSRPNDYGYMFLICVLLLLYGALLPREMYLLILPLAFLCGVAILYRSRLAALSGDSNIDQSRAFTLRSVPYLLAHILLTMCVWGYVYSVMPDKKAPGAGVVEVSFLTDNENYLPPEFGRWFRPEKVVSSPDGKVLAQKGQNPVESKSGPPVQANSKAASTDGRGSGAGQPGKDLVFRVKSPVKMYWVGKLYDRYDGEKWISTEQMEKQNVPWTNNVWKTSGSIEQKFIIEKWLSPVLYSAYRASLYILPQGSKINTLKNFYTERLEQKDQYPPTPFAYSVNSYVCANSASLPEQKEDDKDDGDQPKDKPKNPYWLEKLKPQHYLQLPDKKISKRVRQLSAQITMGIVDEYSKAMALRDYLRKNFKYEQFAKKVPADRETADYFLFDLKEGHCEYYACALAVMARINGLPARVATGFSPGNYNRLNDMFEVHEYHAHAWTQIFVEGKGWLTMDATPPGQIVSKTLPMGIGSLNDPFGNEWKVTPPELTENAQKMVLSQIEKFKTAGMDGSENENNLPLITRTIVSIASAPEEIGIALENLKKKYSKDVDGKKQFSAKALFEAVKKNASAMLAQAWEGWKKAAAWLASRQGVVCVSIFAAVALAWRLTPKLRRLVYRRHAIKKCMLWKKKAESKIKTDPRLAVSICYRITREILNAGGWPREKNMELFNYGASLKKIDKMLCKNTLVIYFLYTKYEYGNVSPDSKDALAAYDRTCQIIDFVLNRGGPQTDKRRPEPAVTAR